jgi:hypothetical protein
MDAHYSYYLGEEPCCPWETNEACIVVRPVLTVSTSLKDVSQLFFHLTSNVLFRGPVGIKLQVSLAVFSFSLASRLSRPLLPVASLNLHLLHLLAYNHQGDTVRIFWLCYASTKTFL